jgi:hypothetical protein
LIKKKREREKMRRMELEQEYRSLTIPNSKRRGRKNCKGAVRGSHCPSRRVLTPFYRLCLKMGGKDNNKNFQL